MISVVIPTLNSEAGLAATLTSLVPAAVDGLVREAIVVDGGSTDRTLEIADHAGADILKSEPGLGTQLRAGAAKARFPWLLFLQPDTELEPGWEREVGQFIERVEAGRRRDTAAAFRFAVDDEGVAPRLLEGISAVRSKLFKAPYGDQGLLISRALYNEIGGYADLPMLADLDIARRLGRKRISHLRARAVSSPARLQREGYFWRMLRNLVCLTLFVLRVPAQYIAKLFGAKAPLEPHPLRGSTR
jgi:glycosyltransferase involved in cell wall biosynthesis